MAQCQVSVPSLERDMGFHDASSGFGSMCQVFRVGTTSGMRNPLAAIGALDQVQELQLALKHLA